MDILAAALSATWTFRTVLGLADPGSVYRDWYSGVMGTVLGLADLELVYRNWFSGIMGTVLGSP